ncbi:hypothetical protein FNO01nite_23540 [Flavobacterium noncentrifugens]|uniref:Ketosteroid isomerase homolog n=1 Tax=Flavobacterium noncentrifugens TaxID=1128970 RepID=A0A1G9B2L6_9FLAO|nr:nuclear transport factor 2 family protein [Flavobacterium noncentrifugens]GEP51682.1 hypothetical protein FNO01nite_23540 [Flavobacterium noncentrifugens]SDK33713.1 Ketosteroid isomerase homolog [Flavobacterium noncentrifugens]
MKKMMFKGMAFCMIAATILACTKKDGPPPPPPMADASQIKTELQSMETAFADAMTAGKPDGIVYYADDATSFSQNKAPFVGREAIHKNMKEEMATAPKGAKVTYETQEVFPSPDGSQVVEIGSYKMTDNTNAVVSSGNFMALFLKKDGKYVCIRDMGTSDMPKK